MLFIFYLLQSVKYVKCKYFNLTYTRAIKYAIRIDTFWLFFNIEPYKNHSENNIFHILVIYFGNIFYSIQLLNASIYAVYNTVDISVIIKLRQGLFLRKKEDKILQYSYQSKK